MFPLPDRRHPKTHARARRRGWGVRHLPAGRESPRVPVERQAAASAPRIGDASAPMDAQGHLDAGAETRGSARDDATGDIPRGRLADNLDALAVLLALGWMGLSRPLCWPRRRRWLSARSPRRARLICVRVGGGCEWCGVGWLLCWLGGVWECSGVVRWCGCSCFVYGDMCMCGVFVLLVVLIWFVYCYGC